MLSGICLLVVVVVNRHDVAVVKKCIECICVSYISGAAHAEQIPLRERRVENQVPAKRDIVTPPDVTFVCSLFILIGLFYAYKNSPVPAFM